MQKTFAAPLTYIFIHESARTKALGEDLFPRSFIINLPAPSNYTGAAEIFGIKDDDDRGLTERAPLPIIRNVEDHAASAERSETAGWMPPKLEAKTGHVPLFSDERRVPPSLRKAILCFVLSTAVRGIREPLPQFNSMLVHVVRFTNVQNLVHEQVDRELKLICHRLIRGDGDRSPTILDEGQAAASPKHWTDGRGRTQQITTLCSASQP